MDKVLPLELLYKITKYLKAKDYVRLRMCSSQTFRLREVVLVDFDEYEELTDDDVQDTFATRHILQLRDCSINSMSFRYAALKRHSFELIRILESRHAADISQDSKTFAFERALILYRFKQYEVITTILKDGAIDLNEVLPSFRGINAIQLACHQDIPALLKFLLTMTDTIAHPSRTRPPQHFAALYGCPEVIQILIDDGRFDFGAVDCYGDTCLHLAVNRGRASVIPLLLREQSVDVNVRSKGGNIPLLMAAGNYDPNTLRLLLNDARVDVHVVGDSGYHAIHMAINRGRLENLKLLLDHHRLHHWSEPQAISELLKMARKRVEQLGVKGDVANLEMVDFLTEKTLG
jgi:Ankyrin repeats (3 copies)